MIIDLGLIDYEEAYKIQKELVKKRKLGEIEDALIVAEHPAVFTIGRTGKRENLLVTESYLEKNGIKLLDVDRGGDITFHGPGQIVAYPIIDLSARKRDLHQYLRDLEEAVIRFFRRYSVDAKRSEGKTGVWAENKKIAFIGIGASNWITYHGLSININTDLSFFSMIVPCGLKDTEATSLKEITNKEADMALAKERLGEEIARSCAALA